MPNLASTPVDVVEVLSEVIQLGEAWADRLHDPDELGQNPVSDTILEAGEEAVYRFICGVVSNYDQLSEDMSLIRTALAITDD